MGIYDYLYLLLSKDYISLDSLKEAWSGIVYESAKDLISRDIDNFYVIQVQASTFDSDQMRKEISAVTSRLSPENWNGYIVKTVSDTYGNFDDTRISVLGKIVNGKIVPPKGMMFK